MANYIFLTPSNAVIKVKSVQQAPVIPTGQATSEEAIEKNFAVSGPATLALDNAFGDVVIHGDPALKEIQVQATKKAWGTNAEAAAKILQQMNVSMSQSGDNVTITVKQPNQPGQNQVGEVTFQVAVPTSTKVNASTASGSVRLDGVEGAQKIGSTFGNVQASNIEGPLAADTQSGDVRATGIQAGDGNITLSSAFGNVTLDDGQAAGVALESKSGTVSLYGSTTSGGVSLKSSFGRVTVLNGKFTWLDAYTQSGEIELTEVQASEKVKAFSSFGMLRLVGVESPLYDLATQSGDVNMNGASGKVMVDASQGSIDIFNGKQATLDLKSQSGNLAYAGSLGDGPHSLTSAFGNVQLALPPGSAFNADLESKFGRIQSELDVTMGGTLEDSHWIGKVNGGGPQLTVSTSGDITIEGRE